MSVGLLPLVLIADDEINTTIMLQHIFERAGYRVERANDGISALEKARQLRPDLILLDILMPKMNGFDVLMNLRSDEKTATIPIIMITANARQPSDVARGLKLGADDYLYKPFAPQELLARAQSKIRARQLEEALQRRSDELAALLQLSDALNEHLAVGDLVQLAAASIDQLLPADLILIQYLNQDQPGGSIHLIDRTGTIVPDQLSVKAFSTIFQNQIHLTWENRRHLLPAFSDGLVQHLQQSEEVIGMLLVARQQGSYDADHRRLFAGIGLQVALALHNARLYELQADYAQTLERRVAERTRELESAQRLLLRSEKLASIGNLAASIAHEINTPLQPIRTLLTDIVDDLQQRGVSFDQRDFEIIQESLERIRGIVSRLLEFARDPRPGLQLVDVSSVLESILKLNRKFFEHSRIRIESSLPTLPPIYASKDQLEQVFMNLTLNAQAAMPDGGRLRVTVQQISDREIAITFADTGIGILPEHLDRIFDPFFSTKPNGTGLGLFVSHGIIQGHNGRMEVASTPNSETTFTIYLPTQIAE